MVRRSGLGLVCLREESWGEGRSGQGRKSVSVGLSWL